MRDLPEKVPKAPHHPAAFINALREEGSKEDILTYLQEQWNETCTLSAKLAEMTKERDKHRAAAEDFQEKLMNAYEALAAATNADPIVPSQEPSNDR